jgi:hypothetical protein
MPLVVAVEGLLATRRTIFGAFALHAASVGVRAL